MKKFLSLLLVFAMLVCYLPAGAFAAEADYYVAGSSSLCGSNWANNDDANKMELNADGLYEKTFYSVPAGKHEFKVTDGTWDNCWGMDGNNYVFETTEVQNVTITFDAESKAIDVKLSEATEAPEAPETEPSEPVVEGSYYVAGSSSLCGSNWANNDDANKMELNADGLYEKTFYSVPAGKHEFKVTDGTWDNCWGMDGNNYVLETTEVQNVTITFDAESKAIKVELSEATEAPETDPTEPSEPTVEEKFYTVAGTGSLCGSEWNPADESNKMTLNADGLYEKYFIGVPAGVHKFKVTDGTWSNCWGNGDDGDGNTVFTTNEVKNVLITFNDTSKEIAITLIDVVPYYVAGTDGLCGVGWDPGYEANKMLLHADGLYRITFKSVPAGHHEFKVTDGTWDNSWGMDGNNYIFDTEEDHNVTIVFNADTKVIEVILSEATPKDPVGPTEPVEYDITINVHYYRPDGNYADWEVHMWNGVDSLSATRKFAEETVEYEGKQWKVATYYADASDVWVGFIIKTPAWTKDPDGDRHIDISDVTGGTVNVYAVSGSALEDFVTDKSQATLGAKVTAAVYDYKTSTIEVTVSYPLGEDATVDTFKLEGPEGQMTISKIEKIDDKNYRLTYEGIIDEMDVYTLYFNEVPCVVTIPNTYSTEDFEADYTYTGDDLGATWTKDATTFRVWAPTAAAASVNLYTSGTAGTDDLIQSVEMTADVNGTWVATVEGDLNGVYYTYSVTRKGETVEAVDPYARTTGVNGNRGMVIDLDSTDPEGWENDTYVTQSSYTDAVIWELHVRDFSIDETSGMTNKGKYLAFTERGTKVPGKDIATGVDYMVDLGINYVHLLPVYDINSVDETVGGYNWGYDPKNYNVPEGSYSTDPYNGAVRVNEFKQMVQSLHEAGIGVIMDVVYNHVADAGQFCFNQIVPGYFSRIHDDGSYQSNSGCGNDTATERSMVSKYIVDSVLYWCEEYHIDGFRWDLVGLIDYETINAVMEAVHEVNPDIIFYGEGWEMCSWTTKEDRNPPYSKRMTIQPNDHLVNTEAGVFAFFNDTIRNVIHGGVFTATDKGFVCGNLNEGTKQTVIDGYMGYSQWGSNGARVDTPLQTVNYASCHDNYTLYDNFTVDAMDLTGKPAAQVKEQAAIYNNMAAAYYITAQGVPFIHAGEEMLRSKPDAAQDNGFNHNSYSAGDAINSFKWGELGNMLNKVSYEYYKGLIAFRKAHPALRMTDQAEILATMEVLETGSNDLIAILNNGGNGEDVKILTIINTGKFAKFTLPAGKWDAYVFGSRAGTDVLTTVEGTIGVGGQAVMILVLRVEEPVQPLAAPVITTGNDAATGKILVSWEKVEGAVGYEVLRSTDKVNYETVATVTKTSYLDKNTEVNTRYYYKVRAIAENPAANSGYSKAVSRLCDLEAPKITMSNVASSGKIKISWEPIEGAVEYVVYRSSDNENWIRMITTEKTAATHISAEAGVRYYYKVRAVAENKYANSAYSAVKNRLCDLEAPKITMSNVASSGKIKISWEKVEGAVKYEIYRSTNNKNWSRMLTTTKTAVTNTSTEAGVRYYYKVRAIAENTNANSAFSSVKSRMCDLARPTLAVSLNSKGKPTLTWNAVEDAVKYTVYVSTDGENWTRMLTTTKTSATNISAVAGKTYYYKVRAVAEDTVANSAYSAVKSIKAK